MRSLFLSYRPVGTSATSCSHAPWTDSSTWSSQSAELSTSHRDRTSSGTGCACRRSAPPRVCSSCWASSATRRCAAWWRPVCSALSASRVRPRPHRYCPLLLSSRNPLVSRHSNPPLTVLYTSVRIHRVFDVTGHQAGFRLRARAAPSPRLHFSPHATAHRETQEAAHAAPWAPAPPAAPAAPLTRPRGSPPHLPRESSLLPVLGSASSHFPTQTGSAPIFLTNYS